MLSGYNTDFKFQGKVYHCQTEDGGVSSPAITSLLYHQGAILASRKTSYADIIKADCLEDVVRELMMEQHKQMIRDLMQGRFQTGDAPQQPAPPAAPVKEAAPAAPAPAPAAKAPPPPKHEEVREKSLDDVILEFLEQEEKANKGA
jgi:hypothetical protein